MNFSHLYSRLLFIFIFSIVSTLAKTELPSVHSPSPGPSSTLLPGTVPEMKKYPTLSSLFPSLIQVGAPPSPRAGSGGRARKHSRVKGPSLHQLDSPAEAPTSFPGPGPSPSLQPVSSSPSPFPVNAEPGIYPTTLPFPSPDAGSGSRSRRHSDDKSPLMPNQSEPPAEVPTSSPGPSPGPWPSPTLQPASSSPVSAQPEMSPTSPPFPSLIQSRAIPSPQDSTESRLRHRKVPLPPRSDATGPGPSPTLQPVLSPKSLPSSSPQFPDSPVMTDSEESPEGPDGDRSQETPSDEQESYMEMDYSEPEEEEEETGNAMVDVKKVCETTDYPSLCVNTVHPLLVNSENNNVSLNSILGASINATDDVAKVALLAAKKIAHFPGTPPELASVLEVCEETYQEALDNFDKAKEAYDTQDVGTMNTMLSAVISNIEDCNTEVSSLNIPLPAPVAEFGDKLRNMTSNCLAIVSLY